jgi:mono/diheme cytochrome c family protein
MYVRRRIGILVAAASMLAATGPAWARESSDVADIARGRSLVLMGGCNDCHTPGFAEAGLSVPEAQWLTGSAVGFQGPWGVSYGSNLRLLLDGLGEAEWLVLARRTWRPPMPSIAL